MPSIFKLSAASALVAALSLAATPAAAVDLPAAASHTAVDIAPAWSPAGETAANHRWRGYRRHNRVDAGDVVAGVLIIGGIAAIANAANRERYRDGDWRYPDNRYPDNRYPGAPEDWRYRDYRQGEFGEEESRGLNRAVEQCVAEIERDQRVRNVDSANRDGNGWRVTGSLYNGAGFTCAIGADGRVEQLDTGGNAGPYRSGESDYSGDRQWDDDRYAAERARVEGAGEEETSNTMPPMPDYPDDTIEVQDSGGEDFDVGQGYEGAG